ncbi:MAG: hypothetical protein SCH71_02225 [Desulfobulbaceae bacterium]|nr:hypothetical protein [Desulfobulbaceae bacterium]
MRQKVRCIAGVLFFLLATGFVNTRPAHSFHDGGVGSCDSCHSMHEAKDRDAATGDRTRYLLVASDPSSVCLNCHAGTGGPDNISIFSPDGSAMTPGGDFYWLTKTFTWSGGSSLADSHGHNVVAFDFNLGQDLRLTQSPGGSYLSENLGCTSCHDPHGRSRGGTRQGAPPVSVSGSYGELPAGSTGSGSYRLLGDSGYGGGGSSPQEFLFSYDAPIARQNTINRFGESDESHVDYGIGMSEWCGNCHDSILRNNHSGAGDFVHPSGSSETLISETVSMYNSYINTGDLAASITGSGTGSIDTAYLQFVPFERGISDPQFLDPVSRRGPNTNSRIMCLTCHRAHASAFSSAGRWDFDAVLLAESHPGQGDGGVAGNDVHHSYYGRNISAEFGPDQGPFCEKCHGFGLDILTDIQEPILEQDFDIQPEVDTMQFQRVDPLLQDPFQP